MSEELDAMSKKLDDACKGLGEFFDSVKIIATYHPQDESKNTVIFDSGHGNWHAQVGSVREWLTKQEARTFRHGWDHTYQDGEK